MVVRDDLLPGGTKARVAHLLFDWHIEYVYASPVYGYAQIALAYAAKAHGKLATIFCAKRKHRHARTEEARRAGAKLVEIPSGYLSVVRSRAIEYCAVSGAKLIPFGFDTPEIHDALADLARTLPCNPKEVWSVAGSGLLSRSLQAAWPQADFRAVRVGAAPDAGRAHIFTALETFEQDARVRPPFPSCSNYDAKAWHYIRECAKPGALFWNVAG